MSWTYSRISVHTFRGAGVRGELSGKLPASKLKGLGFKSQLGQQENFLVQGELSVLTLILVLVPPLCYCYTHMHPTCVVLNKVVL